MGCLDRAGLARNHLVALACALSLSCGAKTGLLIPDASRGPDAGMDAGPDAGPDSGVCQPRPVALVRRGAQVMFVVDRSSSMADTFDGRDPEPGELRRWDLVGQVLGQVLGDADPLLEVGAKFYPRALPEVIMTPEEACSVDTGIDLSPNRGNVPAFLDIFATTEPRGGTPTALGLGEVRDFFASRPAPGVPRFVILATDGGPNCNPDTGIPHTVCLCTGQPEDCSSDATFGPFNCIDEMRTLEVIESIFTDNNIPVYVIGILDPTRPDLADVLDQMADAGGRPREVPGERRFYSAAEPDDLRAAVTTITESIARCVFRVDPVPGPLDRVELRIDDILIPRDPGRIEGWDFTSEGRSELTLFGGACERVTRTGGEVSAEIECIEEE
jgi:hypothetical protein